MAGQSLTEYRRFYLHAVFFLLAFAAVSLTASGAIGRVAGTLVAKASEQAVVANSESKGYLRPPVVLNTSPGLYLVKQQPEPTAQPTAQPTQEPTPEATPAPQPAYFLYTIQPGDSVASIAAAFGVDASYILLNNPHLSEDPDLLLIGEQLQIPSVNGLIYQVKLGDTLSDLSAVYQVDIQSIVAFVPNGLASPDQVIEGMVLLLPGAVPPPPPIPAAVTAVETSAPALAEEPAEEPSSPAPSSAGGLIWPFHGAVSQYFGGYHRGVDIDGFGNYGAAIAAAASGQVVLTAYLEWGLGHHVVIRHDDGSEAVYAHLSEIYVTQGQFVSQGEAVGALGSTGYSTGPHLHFELHIGGAPVDPLLYLP